MDRHLRARAVRRPSWGLALALVPILLLAIPPVSAVRTSGAGLAAAASGTSISATVTWDGRNIAGAPTASSAFTASLAGSFDLIYTWSVASVGTSGAGLPTISDARLTMLYFGASLSTRDVIETNALPAAAGRIYMNWTPPAILHDLVAGTFELTASLLDPNGTTYWTQNFYIDGTAPYTVGALIPILLILVGVYEVYGLLTSGRQALAKASKEPAAGGTTAGGPTPSPTPGPEPAGEPPEEKEGT